MADDHVVVRDAEMVGDDLGEGRLVPLAVRARSGNGGDLAAPFYPDNSALPAQDIGGFDIRRDTDPHDLATPARLGLRSAQISIVRQLHHAIERSRVVSGVVGDAERRAVGERLGRDEVPPANLDGIEAGRPSRLVHEALDEVDADGPPRSTVGSGRRGVRVHADAQKLGVLDPIRTEDMSRVGHRGHERQREQVGPQIEDGLRPETNDLSIGGHRAFGFRDGRSRLDRGEQVLGPGGHPPDGPAELARERRRDDLLAVEWSFHSEAAADVRRDHAQLVLREAEHRRKVGARQKGILGRQPERQLVAAGVVAREHAAGLHRGSREPVMVEAHLHDVRCPPERSIDVAALKRPAERLVGTELGVGEGGPRLETALRAGDGRKRLVLDLDQVGGIAGQRRALGNDRRDRHAGRVDDAVGQIRTPGLLQPRERRHEGKRPQRAEIRGRHDAEHARRPPRRVGPERGHARVSMRAPQED